MRGRPRGPYCRCLSAEKPLRSNQLCALDHVGYTALHSCGAQNAQEGEPKNTKITRRQEAHQKKPFRNATQHRCMKVRVQQGDTQFLKVYLSKVQLGS
jgi:hypothetical protein